MNENRLGAARPALARPEDARPGTDPACDPHDQGNEPRRHAQPGANPLDGPHDQESAARRHTQPGAGPRDQGNERRRHRLTRMWVFVAVAAAIAAGGVAAALSAAPGGHPPSALATVTGALAETSAGSYRFTLDTVVPSHGSIVPPVVVSGAFDPGHGLGTELLTTRYEKRPVWMRIRFIGKYVYTRVSPGSGLGLRGEPWDKSPVPSAGADAMPPGEGVYSFVSDRPVSPAALAQVLRSAGTVHDEGAASGPGWTGTRYAFAARLPGGQESVTGTAYVDRQGRVRRLVTITQQGQAQTDRDLIITGFGAPVPVTAPPATQVQYTSKPYSGFYF